MVNPFLHRALHLHFVYPVDVIGRGFVVWRLCNDAIQLFIIVMQHFIHIVAVHLKPGDELGMEHIIFFKRVTRHIGKGDMNVFVVGIHLATALVADHKDGFDARGGLGADADGTCGRNGQHGDVAASHSTHLLVEVLVQGAQTLDEGVVLFAFGIIHGELATFFGQIDG